MFAERYGYTLNDFYALTLRQVFHIKKALEKAKTRTMEWEAALAGKPIKKKAEGLGFTPEEEKENDEKAKQLLERMKAEYGNRTRATDTDQRNS